MKNFTIFVVNLGHLIVNEQTLKLNSKKSETE